MKFPNQSSQPRINLRQQIPTRIIRPIPTILIRRRWNEQVFDIGGPLHDVGVQAARKVPGDVAVKGPDARVILLPLEDLFRKEGD